MRIVIASNYKVGNETGTAFVSEELCKELSKKNKVTYICVGTKFKQSRINKNLTFLTAPSIEINNYFIPLITPQVISSIYRYLDKFDPDIIHAQNPFLISSLVQKWANVNKVPYLVTFHHIPTQAVEHLLPTFSKNIITKVIQEIYTETSLKKFLEKTNGVIALNNNVKESIRKIDKKISIKIINNGLDLRSLLKIKVGNIQSTIINFVFLGSYTERKNQEYLIKVFSTLPNNYHLTCYGNKKTGGNYLKSLESLMKELKTKNIFLKDYTKNRVKVFKNTDYFASASTKEAQSLAIIEALAAAKPVIGLKNETTSELINKSNGLVLPPKTSPKKFGKEILRITREINYREIAGQTRKSSDKFRIEKVIPKIKEFYLWHIKQT